MTRDRGAAGVLLTGGASRRLGVDKARLDLGGETLAQRTARVLAEVCDPCIEVGSGASPLRCVRETPRGAGPLAAFVHGVRTLAVCRDSGRSPGIAAHSESVMLLACDMPGVSSAVLRCLLDRPHPTVIPVVCGRAQYGCAKYGGAVLEAMQAAYERGVRSFRWLADDHHDDIEWIDESVWGRLAGEDAFRDVDTRDDAASLGIRIP